MAWLSIVLLILQVITKLPELIGSIQKILGRFKQVPLAKRPAERRALAAALLAEVKACEAARSDELSSHASYVYVAGSHLAAYDAELAERCKK
jgi:Sec-independent protein translocase protein TatA